MTSVRSPRKRGRRREHMASSCERASEAGVFARALDEVPARFPAATPSPRLPPSLPPFGAFVFRGGKMAVASEIC